MWEKGWRDRAWANLDQKWDLIVIGGGITGAGIFREAAKSGLKVLLVEAQDFASGTSSRSGKLVHGGLRYLKNAQVKLTYESVREREFLLKDGRGLVSPLGFLLAGYKGDHPPLWVYGAGLILYDILAKKWSHRYYDSYDLHELCPTLKEDQLIGGYRFFDAQTDDARLVLRVLREGVAAGGCALNYAAVTGLLKTKSPSVRNPAVCGVILEDRGGQIARQAEVQARVVINATGAWADHLRQAVGATPRLRKLRGSHLILPHQRLPLTRAVSLIHPKDRRPVYVFPWEGITLVGTTDIDHTADMNLEPRISAPEFDYLLQAVQILFPCQELEPEDVQCTFAGVRPVIGTGKKDPSKESREHVLWQEDGLITVTGGKLTTFRLMARSALQRALHQLGKPAPNPVDEHILDPLPAPDTLPASLPASTRLRILGRYGCEAPEVLADAAPALQAAIDHSPALWAELVWSARKDGVVHLEDLLLRRTRLGLTLPHGGLPNLDEIRALTGAELDWDNARWDQEIHAYTALWNSSYRSPVQIADN